jgi:hypothetical protein
VTSHLLVKLAKEEEWTCPILPSQVVEVSLLGPGAPAWLDVFWGSEAHDCSGSTMPVLITLLSLGYMAQIDLCRAPTLYQLSSFSQCHYFLWQRELLPSQFSKPKSLRSFSRSPVQMREGQSIAELGCNHFLYSPCLCSSKSFCSVSTRSISSLCPWNSRTMVCSTL